MTIRGTFRRARFLAGMLLLVCLLLPAGAALADPSFVNNEFQAKWQRADKPVQDGTSNPPRSWLWGPESFLPPGGVTTEPYADSPGGSRKVDYFDKARVELNNPSTGLVTNGLLVIEMISGREATGDATNITRKPADIPVAGDAVNNDGPTYASLASVASLNFDKPSPDRTGQLANETLNKAGQTGAASAALAAKAKYVYFDKVLKHNIPDVFWNFMNQKGNIFENGKLVDNQPILGSNPAAPWLDATGYPLTEAYWTRVTVGGVVKDVLVQAFQRRVLTFTPDNPAQYQVEMGNVGRHYFTWRYSPSYDIPTTPPPTTTPVAPKPPTEPTGTVKGCSDLPTSTARTPFNCGPAGMPVKIAAEYQPGEVVTIDRYDPGNNLVQTFQGTTNSKGQFEITLDSWPTNTPGFWTYKLRGKVSGKELVLYVWLEQPSSKPTMIASPTSGNTDQIFDFLVTGFMSTDFIHFGLIAPDGQSFATERINGTRVGSGGGLIFSLRFGDDPPFNQKGTWTVVITANDLSHGYRFCTVQITITD
jgi:hypothetical protein